MAGRTPGIYAIYATGRTPSPTLLGFQLYAISGRAHFRHRPMQLRAIHRGWAHSQAFGGNVSAFNANATSQVSTRFAQLVWPHGYCWYPPARFNKCCTYCKARVGREEKGGLGCIRYEPRVEREGNGWESKSLKGKPPVGVQAKNAKGIESMRRRG